MSTPQAPKYKRPFNFQSPDDLDKLNNAVADVAKANNVPTKTYPNAKPAPQPQPQSNVTPLQKTKPRKQKASPVRRVSVDLPLSLIKQINSRAFNNGQKKPIRAVYLEAFRAAGFKVNDSDIPHLGETYNQDDES